MKEFSGRTAIMTGAGSGIDMPLLAKNLDDKAIGQLSSLHPAGRLGTPKEVSALTCFLLSSNAGFITGSYHLVDGGYSALDGI